MGAERRRHDILNALNAVRGYAELLASDLPEGQHRDWAIRILAASAEAMTLAEGMPRDPPLHASPDLPHAPARSLLLAAPAGRAPLLPALEAAGWEPAHALTAAEATAALRAGPGLWSAVLVDTALAGADAVLSTARAAGVPATGLPLDGAPPDGIAGQATARLTHTDASGAVPRKGV